MTRLFVLWVALACAGCAQQLAQQVNGVVTVEGRPLPSGEVRLASGKDSTTCLGPSAKARVAEGQFSLEREVEVADGDKDAQRDGLCIKDGGIWQLVWHSVYKPAPKTLAFTCNKENQRWTCKANGLESSL